MADFKSVSIDIGNDVSIGIMAPGDEMIVMHRYWLGGFNVIPLGIKNKESLDEFIKQLDNLRAYLPHREG